MSIEGLVFDFDGLILDTEMPIFQAWVEIYQEHAVELPLEKWLKILGTNNHEFDPARYLISQAEQPIDLASLELAQSELAAQKILKNDALPGVREYLKRANELGLGMAVASSSSSSWVESKLERLGLRSYFTGIFTSDYVAHVKPDPALYHLAVEHLGLHPSQALALEDSPNGLKAAKRAGLKTLAVRTEFTREMPLENADLILNSMLDMPLDQVLHHFNGSNGSKPGNGRKPA